MQPPSVHPVLKPSEPAALCLELKDCQMNRCLYAGSSGAKEVLVRLCLIQIDHRIDRRLLPMDCRFILRCRFLRADCCFFS
jgi:hypothetical protein